MLSIGEISKRTGLSRSQITRLLAKDPESRAARVADAETGYRIHKLYPRIVEWERADRGARLVTRVKGGTTFRHSTYRFFWVGDFTPASELSGELTAPSSPLSGTDIASEPRAEIEPALASEPASDPADDGYTSRRVSLIAALHHAPDPAKMLTAWDGMDGMASIVARLRADAEVQALLASEAGKGW